MATGLRTAIVRGTRRRCPQCGRGALFRGWLTVRSPCLECGLEVVEDEGDPWLFVILLDRIFVLVLLGFVYFRLGPPNSWFIASVFAAVIGVFVYTTPHRFGACLAFVYWLRERQQAPGRG